jgi:hypothetical protein
LILLSAVGLGLLVGFGRARWLKQEYRVLPFRHVWLVVIAFLPQLLVTLRAKDGILPAEVVGLTLVFSVGIFLVFVWLNLRLPGMLLLLGGLILNLAVMLANGGLMPINPQTASRLVSEEKLQSVAAGDRFGQKDVLMPRQEIRLESLSDRFLPPAWSPYQVAFSLGDIFIGAGAFWFLVAGRKKE